MEMQFTIQYLFTFFYILLFSGQLVNLDVEQLDAYLNDNIHRDPSTSRWTCSICNVPFINRKDVARHIEAKHVSLPELQCPICGKAYKTRHSMSIHLKKAHGQI